MDPEAKPLPGQVKRLIQASGGNVLQVAFHHDGATPQPTPMNPTPREPAPEPTPVQPSPQSDDGKSDDDTALIFGAIAAAGLAVAEAFGVVTVARKR